MQAAVLTNPRQSKHASHNTIDGSTTNIADCAEQDNDHDENSDNSVDRELRTVDCSSHMNSQHITTDGDPVIMQKHSNPRSRRPKTDRKTDEQTTVVTQYDQTEIFCELLTNNNSMNNKVLKVRPSSNVDSETNVMGTRHTELSNDQSCDARKKSRVGMHSSKKEMYAFDEDEDSSSTVIYDHTDRDLENKTDNVNTTNVLLSEGQTRVTKIKKRACLQSVNDFGATVYAYDEGEDTSIAVIHEQSDRDLNSVVVAANAMFSDGGSRNSRRKRNAGVQSTTDVYTATKVLDAVDTHENTLSDDRISTESNQPNDPKSKLFDSDDSLPKKLLKG